MNEKRIKIKKNYKINLAENGSDELERYLYQYAEFNNDGHVENFVQYDRHGNECLSMYETGDHYEYIIFGEKSDEVLPDLKNMKYVYDHLGRQCASIEKDSDGNSEEKLIFKYLGDTNHVVEMITEINGSVEDIVKSDFDNNGNEIKTVHLDQQNNIRLSKEYEYDNFNRVIRKIEKFENVVSFIELTYYDESKLVKEEFVAMTHDNGKAKKYKRIFEYEFFEE